jgi:hypothetical protein
MIVVRAVTRRVNPRRRVLAPPLTTLAANDSPATERECGWFKFNGLFELKVPDNAELCS